jgi:mono/diheme cytochrome c family protein
MRRIILAVGAVATVALLVVQLVPYGRDHTNPPVTAEPAWDSVATRELAVRACFDCHSNETVWPWYANVAPISWRLQSHVDAGREELNFSEWGSGDQEADEAAEQVREGAMPPWDYRLSHPEARLLRRGDPGAHRRPRAHVRIRGGRG